MNWTGRSLYSTEQKAVESIFADKLDARSLRLHISPSANTAFALGRHIFLPRRCFEDGDRLPEDWFHLLVHEAAHVYQYSNSSDYYWGLKPVWTYVTSYFNRDYDPYDLNKAEIEELDFADLTPDEQAEILSEIYRLRNGQSASYNVDPRRLEEWYSQFLQEKHNRTGSLSTHMQYRRHNNS